MLDGGSRGEGVVLWGEGVVVRGGEGRGEKGRLGEGVRIVVRVENGWNWSGLETVVVCGLECVSVCRSFLKLYEMEGGICARLAVYADDLLQTLQGLKYWRCMLLSPRSRQSA